MKLLPNIILGWFLISTGGNYFLIIDEYDTRAQCEYAKTFTLSNCVPNKEVAREIVK